MAEPIIFEVLRHATDEELPRLQEQFDTMLTLAAPLTLWRDAANLGRRCRRRGVNAGSLDLLIASTALHHDAELVTFDADFEQIGNVCGLRVKRLHRPTSSCRVTPENVGALRRRQAVCCVVAPRRCPSIAWVAATCIQPAAAAGYVVARTLRR